MSIDFDFSTIKCIEFGLGLDSTGGPEFVQIPVDTGTKQVLCEMARETANSLMERSDEIQPYDPAEKHGSLEYLSLPLDSTLAASMRDLHTASNLPINTNAASSPESVYCYFARFVDAQVRSLTGVRRSSRFKGVMKSHLLKFWADQLELIEGQIFRLDHDFDFLMDEALIHILRPSGFEFTGRLQSAILAAVPENVAALRPALRRFLVNRRVLCQPPEGSPLSRFNPQPGSSQGR